MTMADDTEPKVHIYKRSQGKLLRWDGERWEEREVSIDYVAPAVSLVLNPLDTTGTLWPDGRVTFEPTDPEGEP